MPRAVCGVPGRIPATRVAGGGRRLSGGSRQPPEVGADLITKQDLRCHSISPQPGSGAPTPPALRRGQSSPFRLPGDSLLSAAIISGRSPMHPSRPIPEDPSAAAYTCLHASDRTKAPGWRLLLGFPHQTVSPSRSPSGLHFLPPHPPQGSALLNE